MMDYFVTLGLLLFFYMSAWFVFSLIKKRNDVADTAWGLGFVLLAWVSFYLGQAQGARGLLVGLLVSIWGIRLAWHIHRRNKGKAEDYRYAKWREDWGKWFYLRSYGQVYLLQGVLLFLIVLPILFINTSSGQDLVFLDFIGLAVWILGFVFESVGDQQLARFIKNPANEGKLMQSGLWRYTRHPNYFGEVMMWWGIWLIALSVPFGFLSIIGPITITILILKVSGIPMLEKKMEENPEFVEYKKQTSIFIPWFRKSI
jgi:steroid 5-alpha reductase family enzyme